MSARNSHIPIVRYIRKNLISCSESLKEYWTNIESLINVNFSLLRDTLTICSDLLHSTFTTHS